MKLQYVATWVRFDISFTASQLASHVANPGPAHWAALHHLMEYLDHYPSFKLVYRRGLRTGQELDAFADSDWGTDVETRKSISGQIGTTRRLYLVQQDAYLVEVQEATVSSTLIR